MNRDDQTDRPGDSQSLRTASAVKTTQDRLEENGCVGLGHAVEPMEVPGSRDAF